MAKKKTISQADPPPRPRRKVAKRKPPAEKTPRVIVPAEADAEDEEDPIGVRCPSCGCGHCPVYYTRNRLKRRIRSRTCRNCGRRFVTTEKANGV